MRNKFWVLGVFLFWTNMVLAQTNFEMQSDYKAVISLYQEELQITFDKKGNLQASTSVIQESSVLKSEGAAMLADKDVYHSFFSELDDLTAYTIKEGKKGKRIPLIKKETKNDRSSYVFYEDGQVTTVYYGELEPGAKTHLDYKLKHRDINILPSKFVQFYLPIENFVYKVVTPNNLNVRFEKKYYGTNHITYTKEENKNTTVHTFTGSNIPAFKSPDYSPGTKHCLPHIVLIVEDYEQGKNKGKVAINKEVQDLYSYYQTYMDKANEEPADAVKNLSKEIVGTATTEREKTKRIFDWVKSKIRYVAFEDGYGGFVPRLATDVCNKRYGDCKDMATTLVHLLRSQNIKAYHTWIGTRDIPYSYSEVPTTASDNHMICGVNIDGEWIFLDATDNQIPFGYVPENIQGKEGLVGISKDSFVVRQLPIAPAAQNAIRDTTWMKIVGQELQGKIHINISGYRAFEMKTYLSYKDEKDKEDYIKSYLYRGNNKCLLDSVKWSSPDEYSIDLAANFKLDSYFQLVGNDIYISTLLNKLYENFRIKEENRTCKADNQWANYADYITYLTLPDGYSVAYKPNNINLDAKNHYSCTVAFNKENNQLSSAIKIQYDLLDIEPAQLKKHNQLIDELNKVYKEVVHLKK